MKKEMVLALRTDAPTCTVRIGTADYAWEAGRGLADGLLGWLEDCLGKSDASFADLTGLIVYRGPGRFTGLRIGITVMNTMADALSIPIVGAVGDDWYTSGANRLRAGDNDTVVLPLYGSEPHITQAKK